MINKEVLNKYNFEVTKYGEEIKSRISDALEWEINIELPNNLQEIINNEDYSFDETFYDWEEAIVDQITDEQDKIKFAPSYIKDNEQYMEYLVKDNGWNLEYASEDIKNNYNIALEAVKFNIDLLDMVGEKLLKDMDFLNEVLEDVYENQIDEKYTVRFFLEDAKYYLLDIVKDKDISEYEYLNKFKEDFKNK